MHYTLSDAKNQFSPLFSTAKLFRYCGRTTADEVNFCCKIYPSEEKGCLPSGTDQLMGFGLYRLHLQLCGSKNEAVCRCVRDPTALGASQCNLLIRNNGAGKMGVYSRKCKKFLINSVPISLQSLLLELDFIGILRRAYILYI